VNDARGPLTDVGGCGDNPREPQTATLLRPQERADYAQALDLLRDQREKASEARSIFENEQFFADAVDDRCVALWHDICAFHRLDVDAVYTVDDRGLVHVKREGSGIGEASQADEGKAASLTPEEAAQYAHALKMRRAQHDRVASARVAWERESFFVAAATDRCTALWSRICAAHRLDARATYKVEDSGLVYITSSEE